MHRSISVDIAVVGGGIAGLVAGLRAAELGAQVVVLERGADQAYACNSRYAGGIFHVCYSDPKLPPATLRGLISRATAGEGRPDLVEAIAIDAGRTMDWLRVHGARFVRGTADWHTFVAAPPRPPSTWLDWKGRGQDVLLRTLSSRLAENRGRLERGAAATSLVMVDSRCRGVRVRRPEGEMEVAAAAVIIADGGFQGNAALFRQYIGSAPERVFQRGAGTGIGDGLRMAIEAGAAHTSLHRFYGHLLSREAFSNDKLWPYPQIDAIAAAAIVVNREGRRFVDERRGGIFIANELARLDDPDCATVVFDATIWDRAGREAQIPPNPMLEKAGGALLRSGSLAGLAAMLDISAESLVASVAEFNRSVSSREGASAIDKPPFYGIPISPGITYTMGGIEVDGNGCVQSRAGGTIEGLYAAGASTGGLEGGAKVGYVGGLIKAAVLGLRAAEHAVRHSPVGTG